MKRNLLERLSRLPTAHLLRAAIALVMLWIGGLKFVPYEAEGIVPMVANSPFMSFFYAHPAPEYRAHMGKEGEVVAANVAWHVSNHTYAFSMGLGLVIMTIGVLLLVGARAPKVGLVAGALAAAMCFTTLSFLVTTPEAWVHAGPAVGFPYLSGMGRLIVKDTIMFAGTLATVAESARRVLASAAGREARALPELLHERLRDGAV